MATKKEIEAAAKSAKKVVVAGKKAEEKKKIERNTTLVEARISTPIEIEDIPEIKEVKVIKTKSQIEQEEIDLLRESLEIEKRVEKSRRNKTS